MFPYKELEVALKLDFAQHNGYVHDFGIPISSDMGLEDVRITMLGRSFLKKLAPSGRNPDADAKALEKFLGLNSSISTHPFEYPTESEQDSLFWDYFRDNFLKCLTPCDADFNLGFIRETFAAGPGASLYCKNDSFYTKLFNSQITASSDYLLSLYRAAISESDTWSEAEMLRSVKFGERIVSSNRLFFVPKTAEISRTCCTEPLVNMLLQKALGAFLESCLAKSFGVSLKTQPDFNRELARIGSVDGSFGTIDLQSASDSISWSLVQRICPSNLLGYFRCTRSERTILPDGSEIDLNMISTMGNGFTFPLQTIIFACAIRAVYQLMNLDSHCPKTQFGVFGDDIIVKSEAYAFLIRSLNKLGFKVNDDKSFNTGSFRESCGYDYNNGHFVRGVYIRSLETVPDVYSAINRLNRWSAMAGVRLTNTVTLLGRFVKRKLRVPFSESIDSGIQVPFKLSSPKVDDRYWFTYRKMVKVQNRLRVPENLSDSRELGYTHYNECGWAIAFLGGFARREDLLFKSETDSARELDPVNYPKAYIMPRELDGVGRIKVVRKSIPYWDWLGPTELSENHPWDREALVDDHRKLFKYGGGEAAVLANSGSCLG
jgi:hypothetical protein